MRSRYSAFALGLGEYLWETLASDHPDRAADRTAAIRELSQAREKQRFMKLVIVDAPPPAANDGEVLFFARIFQKGANRSFAELSQFRREDGRWRYASGVTVGHDALPDPATLDRAAFLAASAAG